MLYDFSFTFLAGFAVTQIKTKECHFSIYDTHKKKDFILLHNIMYPVLRGIEKVCHKLCRLSSHQDLWGVRDETGSIFIQISRLGLKVFFFYLREGKNFDKQKCSRSCLLCFIILQKSD